MVRLTYWMEKYILLSWAVIFICATITLYWALDRTPPIAMRSYTPFNAAPGEYALVVIGLDRPDKRRDCSERSSKYLIDSQGVRHRIGSTETMSPAAVKHMRQFSPDSMKFKIYMPKSASPGPAILIADIEYQCNPVHALWPISVLLEIPIEVLS